MGDESLKEEIKLIFIILVCESLNSFPTTHILYASYCNQLSASLLMMINIAHYWRKLGYVCK